MEWVNRIGTTEPVTHDVKNDVTDEAEFAAHYRKLVAEKRERRESEAREKAEAIKAYHEMPSAFWAVPTPTPRG